jgi:hypothetical protein
VTPADLAASFSDESFVHRLTASAPPVVVNISERNIGVRVVYDYELQTEPPDRIGLSLSAEMVSLVGAIRADFASYGPRHPVRRALTQWERACRRRHRPDALRWRDHADGPLCGLLLFDVAHGCSILWCARRYEVGYPRAERLIAAGLRYVADELERHEEALLGYIHDRDRCDTCRTQDEDA